MSEPSSEKHAPGKHPNSQQNLTPFKKGKSGNPQGRPLGKSARQMMRDVQEREVRKVIEKMFHKAQSGDVRAAELIFKYSDDASILEGSFTINITRASGADEVGAEETDAGE